MNKKQTKHTTKSNTTKKTKQQANNNNNNNKKNKTGITKTHQHNIKQLNNQHKQEETTKQTNIYISQQQQKE